MKGQIRTYGRHLLDANIIIALFKDVIVHRQRHADLRRQPVRTEPAAHRQLGHMNSSFRCHAAGRCDPL